VPPVVYSSHLQVFSSAIYPVLVPATCCIPNGSKVHSVQKDSSIFADPFKFPDICRFPDKWSPCVWHDPHGQTDIFNAKMFTHNVSLLIRHVCNIFLKIWHIKNMEFIFYCKTKASVYKAIFGYLHISISYAVVVFLLWTLQYKITAWQQ